MKAKLIKIGNSRGVRLPRPLIEEAGLSDEVDVRVKDRTILIRAARSARTGWAEAARVMGETGDGQSIGTDVGTRFDEEDWQW